MNPTLESPNLLSRSDQNCSAANDFFGFMVASRHLVVLLLVFLFVIKKTNGKVVYSNRHSALQSLYYGSSSFLIVSHLGMEKYNRSVHNKNVYWEKWKGFVSCLVYITKTGNSLDATIHFMVVGKQQMVIGAAVSPPMWATLVSASDRRGSLCSYVHAAAPIKFCLETLHFIFEF